MLITTQREQNEFVGRLAERWRAENPQDPEAIHAFSHAMTDDLDTLWGLSVTLGRPFLGAGIDCLLVYEKVAGIIACGYTARFLGVKSMIGAERLSQSYHSSEWASSQINAARYYEGYVRAGIKKNPLLEGKRVLVMDDIIDGGGTVMGLLNIAAALKLNVIGIASLVAKHAGLEAIRSNHKNAPLPYTTLKPRIVTLVEIIDNNTLISDLYEIQKA